MKYLYVTTPTTVEERELFTLGLTSKRDAGKIGHKGSGLKFTLALLHRLDSHLEVKTPAVHLVSQSSTQTIRGAEHQLITLCSPPSVLLSRDGVLSNVIETHITQAAGADTWTEPWFALRELVQNAIDENGEFYVIDDLGVLAWPAQARAIEGATEYTMMRIPLTPLLQAAWDARETWLHQRHPEVIYESNQKGLFYHGFLIYSAPTWRWAYDVTTLISRDKLSEDRQIRNLDIAQLFGEIAQHAIPDLFYEEILNDVHDFRRAPDIQALVDAVYQRIGQDNQNPGGFVMAKLEDQFALKHGAQACFTRDENKQSSEWYFAGAAGFKPAVVSSRVYNLLSYSSRFKPAIDCLPQVAARLVKVKIVGPLRDKLDSAVRLVRRLRPKDCRIRVVKSTYDGDRISANAIADIANNEVLVLESFAQSANENELVETLIEEFVHLSSKATDGTVVFEKALIATIASLIRPRDRKNTEEDSL